MLRKNAIKTAKFLGGYSIVFDHANHVQANVLMDGLDDDHLIVLNAFFQARESLRKSLSARKERQNHNGGLN